MSASRVNVAVIGTGAMARIYADALSERADAKVVAVAGRSPDKTAAFASRYGVKGYDGGACGDLLREQAADAYVVATPEWVRVAPLMELAATGKPILVEKPLAASAEDASQLQLLPADVRARITVAHSLRFSPRFSQAREAVAAGAIGEIRHVYSRRNPSLRSVERVKGRFPLAYWLSCHDIDLLRWILQAEVRSAYAISRNKLASEDDYLIAHLHFTNGVDAIHEVSWCSPPLSDQAPMCRMSIKGTTGLIEVDDSHTGIDVYQAGGVLSSPDTYEVYPAAGFHYGLFAALVDRWLRSVTTGLPAYPSFDDGLSAVDVCTAIMASVASGRPESVKG